MKNLKTKTKKSLLILLGLTVITYNVVTVVNYIEFKTNTFAYWLMEPFNYSNVMLTVSRPKEAGAKEYAYNDQVPVEVVKAEIIEQAKQFGNDAKFMIDLADCESDWDNLAENPISSAEGVFQFLYGTWRETESGKKHISRFSYKDNIREANIKIANLEYSHWAECLN